MKGIRKYIFIFFITTLVVACKEDSIETINTNQSSLNILKGTFNNVAYPDSSTFNAYFLGVGSDDYKLGIPVRLSGLIDNSRDRIFTVKPDQHKSNAVTNGVEYTMSTNQLFRKGLAQDSIFVTIHVGALNDEDNYRLYIEITPNVEFEAGISQYQYYVINFMKNLNQMPNFWKNTSKLNKLTYHPTKCAVFLEVSGITDPDWADAGNSIALDYWIAVCTQWFEDNVVYYENGNRMLFPD